jgi:hypothetical protein
MHNGGDTDDDDTTISDTESTDRERKTNVPDDASVDKLPFTKSEITKIVAVVGRAATPERYI